MTTNTPLTVLIAPDKFKGSLTAAEVITHLGSGLRARGIGYRGCPLADGGDGSVQAALHAGFQPVPVTVTGPTGGPRPAVLAYDGHTCIVEVANTCGLAALPGGVLAPLWSSSRGLGDAVRAAVDLGADQIVLALGGSASTDGGTGMLASLGMRFLDKNGQPLDPCGANLGRIDSIDPAGLLDLSRVQLVIASDVQNPLTGPDGSAVVYGPQKGTTADDIDTLEAGLVALVQRLRAAGYGDADRLARTPGAGSAGGIGFAALLLGGSLVSGAEFFLDLLDFDAQLEGCDLVITGEGRMDGQTRHGKLPAMVADRARPVPVIAVVGRNDVSASDLDALGIRAVYALTDLTDDNPADNAALSARLLRDLGISIPLPGRVRATPGVPGCRNRAATPTL